MDKTVTAKNGAKSYIAVSVPSEEVNAVKSNHEEKFSEHMSDSKPLKEADEQADWNDRTKPDNGACRQGETSQAAVKVANKGTSKLIASGYIQNMSNNHRRSVSARLPFRNTPREYQTSFKRRDSSGNERALDSANRGGLQRHID